MHNSEDEAILTVPVGNRDHIQGSPDAPITLVEYGDYECSDCSHAHRMLQELKRRIGDRMRFVFRHFPLRQQHPHAQKAAEFAEAAGAEGKFWAAHDYLFEHQQKLPSPDFWRNAAETLGLDAAAVLNALENKTYEAHIREDFTSGMRSGVNGTPTYYINGVRHEDPNADDTAETLIVVMNTIAARP